MQWFSVAFKDRLWRTFDLIMSGIVAILNTNGEPVDRELLWSLTNYMRFRGPDEQQVWCDGPIGLGHTMLRTTHEMAYEQQPMTLDGEVWITADARIDDRETLILKLRSRGCLFDQPITDVALILYSYQTWGEACVEHLLGDFAFVIWDSRRKCVFCARDHFGSKPLFFVTRKSLFMAGNTLDCLRLHPFVSARLDELALSDFLLFGEFSQPDMSIFSDIRRLPPAHMLTYSIESDVTTIRRYWSLPIEESIHFHHPEECVRYFLKLFQSSVADRLRTNKVGVFLSGGMDSSSVAALAAELLPGSRGEKSLKAYTSVYKSLIPDSEGHFSDVVATHLGVSHFELALDEYDLFDEWTKDSHHTPEPIDAPLFAGPIDLYRNLVEDSFRVALTGEGGDGLFYPSQIDFLTLMRRMGVSKTLLGMYRSWQEQRRFPPWYLRSTIKTQLRKRRSIALPTFPPWMAYDLVSRFELAERWKAYWIRDQQPVAHATRPQAYQVLSRNWGNYLESFDPGFTRYALEVRNPLFDLRLVRFALRIAPMPYYVNKSLLRRSMRERLPPVILRRPKTPLLADHIRARLEKGWTPKMRELRADGPRVAGEYIDWGRYDQMLLSSSPTVLSRSSILRPLAFVWWQRELS